MIFNSKQEFLNVSSEGRLIALDVGYKTIGISISDENRKIAVPSETIIRKGNKKDFLILKDIFNVKKITGIIIGLPISFDEKDTDCSLFIKRFANNLSGITNLPIIFQDERLSSFEAEDLMLNKIGYNKTKKVVDKIAASYILDSFLLS